MKSIVCWKGGTRKNKNASNRQLKKAGQTETQQRKQEKKITHPTKIMAPQIAKKSIKSQKLHSNIFFAVTICFSSRYGSNLLPF